MKTANDNGPIMEWSAEPMPIEMAMLLLGMAYLEECAEVCGADVTGIVFSIDCASEGMRLVPASTRHGLGAGEITDKKKAIREKYSTRVRPAPASTQTRNWQIPMKRTAEVSSFKGITSIDFFRRAQHYRLAAALTDDQHDVEVFSELAMMFDQIAYAFERIETKYRHSSSATGNPQATHSLWSRWLPRWT
jgi:hypothetical protein